MMGLCGTQETVRMANIGIASARTCDGRETHVYLNNKAVFHGKIFHTASVLKFKLRLIIIK